MIKIENKRANEIRNYICDKIGVSLETLNGTRKYQQLSDARSIGMYLTNYQCGYTSTRTGQAFNRKHATVLNAVKRVKGLIETDFDTRLFVERALIDLGI